MILSGTQVQTGEGWFVSLVVGPYTCERQILEGINKRDDDKTPLQKKLEKIALDIGRLGMYAAILIFHCLLLRDFVESMYYRNYDLFGGELTDEGKKCALSSDDNCKGSLTLYIKNYFHFILVGIALVVVAVPEGLPLAVMISLAYSVKKMLIDNNFVKKLTSCEIMGGANNICSDKTGTLTLNKMTFVKIYSGRVGDIPPPDTIDKYDTSTFVSNQKVIELLSEAICCNCVGTPENAQATEKALMMFISKCGYNVLEVREKYLGKNEEDYIRFHFNSDRKRMSTILNLMDD